MSNNKKLNAISILESGVIRSLLVKKHVSIALLGKTGSGKGIISSHLKIKFGESVLISEVASEDMTNTHKNPIYCFDIVFNCESIDRNEIIEVLLGASAVKTHLESIFSENGAINVTDGAMKATKMISDHYDQNEYRNHPCLGHLYSRFTESVIKESVAMSYGFVNTDHVILSAAKTIKLINQNCDKSQLQK